MNIDKIIFAFAGFMILLSVTLSIFHHQNWLYLAGFIGFNMFQAAFTGFCPMAILLKKLGAKDGCAFK